MSGVPRTPSTPGRDSAVASRSSRSGRLAIAMAVGADAEGAAGRVVGGDEQQPAVRRRAAGAGCGRPSLARSDAARGPGSR